MPKIKTWSVGAVRNSGVRDSLLASTAVAAFLLSSSAAWAQKNDASDGAPVVEQDIIVTARKREETLLNVPVAVSALTGADLARTGATNLAKIADQIPQLSVTPKASGGQITLRGLSSPSTDNGVESSVSVNVDGVQVSRGFISRAAFFDVKQVEVLKGPQALFFGKNSPGGVISVTGAGPGTSFEGYMRAGYEFVADERYIEGAIGGPLTDNFGVRVALRYSKMAGYFTNDAGPAINVNDPLYSAVPGDLGSHRGPADKAIVGRLTLDWKPTNNFSAVLKVLGSLYDSNELTAGSQVVNCAAGHSHPSTLGVEDPYQDCKANNHYAAGFLNPNVVAGYPYLQDKGKPFASNDVYLTSFKMDLDLDKVKLTSVTGYLDLNLLGYGSFDYSTFASFAAVIGERSKTFSQEVRALTNFDGGINFAAGLYYEDLKRTSLTFGRNTLPGATNVVVPDPLRGFTYQYNSEHRTRGSTYSAFGQAIWNIMPNLELSGGVRYTKENRHIILLNKHINQGIPPGQTVGTAGNFYPEGVPLLGDFSDDNWSPEATLNWHPTSNSTLYASYRSGYKSGGFSTPNSFVRTATIAGLTFLSETAKGGEVGYKAKLFNNRLTVNANIYSYEYDNLQRSSFDDKALTFLIRNAASATVRGVELEANMNVGGGFSLRGAVSHNSAKFKHYFNAPCYNGQTAAQGCNTISGSTAKAQDLSGKSLALAPRWVATGGFDFETHLSDRLKIGINGDVKFSSSYATQEDNDPRARQSSYAKLGAGLRLFDADDRWELALIGRNLTNRYVVASSAAKVGGLPGDITGEVERPREVTIQGTVRF